MYKFGTRYYDASQARFTQMDLTGQEKNPYGYASGNAVNVKDPSGNAGLGYFDVLGLVFDVAGAAAAIGTGDPQQIAGEAAGLIVGTLTGVVCEGLTVGLTGGAGIIASGACLGLSIGVAYGVVGQFT